MFAHLNRVLDLVERRDGNRLSLKPEICKWGAGGKQYTLITVRQELHRISGL
jgi:hypothetical protein